MTGIQKHKISIIIPVYNVEGFLKSSLDSVLGQSYCNWEAILVDDGSSDGSGKICDAYAAADSRFKVIHKLNEGPSSARNTALSVMTGDYVIMMDSDDLIHPEYIRNLLDIALIHDADLVQCGYIRGDSSTFPSISDDKGNDCIEIYDNHTVFTSFKDSVTVWGKLYKRKVLEDIKFPEGKIHEDDFTTWKFYYNSSVIAITDVTYYYYRVNPTSIMANQKARPTIEYFKAYEERIDFFKERNETDLEAVTLIQLLKSIILLYGNSILSREFRESLIELYNKHYKALLRLPHRLPVYLRLLFQVFLYIPYPISIISYFYYR